jgi:hypothetical protein
MSNCSAKNTGHVGRFGLSMRKFVFAFLSSGLTIFAGVVQNEGVCHVEGIDA